MEGAAQLWRRSKSRVARNITWVIPAASPLSWYELLWPRKLETKQVNGWLYAISGNAATRGMRFLIVAKKGSIKHYLAIPKRYEESMLPVLQGFIPGLEITPCEHVPELNVPQVSKLNITSKNRVLETSRPEIVSHALLTSLYGVGSKETVFLEWVLGSSKSPEAIPVEGSEQRSGSLSSMVVDALVFNNGKKLDQQALVSLRDKHASAAWKAALFIGVQAENYPRRVQLLNQVKSAAKTADAPGVRIGMKPARYRGEFSTKKVPRLLWPMLVNVNELTGMLGWPLGDQEINGMQRIVSRRLPVPGNMPKDGKILANSVIKHSKRKLVLSDKDALMHAHVIGPTGVGKSTLLLNMIDQDIRNGAGVVVVDPKGDLVNDVLARIPKKRYKDVVVIDPSDVTRPIGLNPLARKDIDPNIIVDDILAIFKNLYGSYFGPRTEDILHSGLLTLATAKLPNMSICNLPPLFNNVAFRNRLLNEINDPLGIGSFWHSYETSSPTERTKQLAPLMNKLRAFLLRPSMRLVMGQGAPKFEISEFLTKDKIVLVNLAKGSLGSEASQLFGSLVVAQVWHAILGRAKVPAAERKPAFVYIDEMQDYLHMPTDIADVLAQARSYGVGMVLAHQNLGQLPKELKSAIESNARSRICFQLANEDAVVMARSDNRLEADDFRQLSRFHVYAKLVINGETSNFMSGKTIEPRKPCSDPDRLKEHSRKKYGRDAAEITVEVESSVLGRAVSKQEKPVVIGRKKRQKVAA